MAEYSSPISGGLNVARTSVSSRAFTGRAMAPIGPDPTTTALLSRNELGLSTVSNQLGGMAQQMNAFGATLERISFYITQDSALQRQRDAQKANQDRILAEQQLREGKESIIERKIQGALISPVTKVAAKAQFTLSRLMGFFGALLGGWLIDQGIQAIQAQAEGNTQKLEEIRDNVLKNVGLIGGIYLAIRTGLFGLINIAARITQKIGKGVLNGLFVKPVQALINATSAPFKSGGNKPATTAPSTSTSAPSTKGNILSSMAAPLIGGTIDFGLDVASGEDPGRAAAGTTGAFTLSAAAAGFGKKLFGSVGGLAFGLGGYALGKGYGKSVYDSFTGGTNPFDFSAGSKEESAAKITPMETMMGDKKEEESKIDFSQPPQFGTIDLGLNYTGETFADADKTKTAESVTPSTEAKTQATQATIAPLKTQQDTQSKVESVGPLPEPAPVVIPPAAPEPTAPAPSGPSGSGSEANTVPNFATSNPDNFYVLYSQVHFNVAM